MKNKLFLAFLFISLFTNASIAQEKKYKVHTIAFYNLENLFDTINGPNFDEEYLPQKGWTLKKYKQKLDNLGRVLPQIGTSDKQMESPAIIGVCEVENRGALEDLVKNYQFAGKDYGVVHYDSPDKRGIDVALLYQKKLFMPTSSVNVPLLIYRNDSKIIEKNTNETAEDKADTDKIEVAIDNRVYTRDILLVTGLLDGEEVNIMVNHWPSRSGGEKRSSPFREAAGRLSRKVMDSIYKSNPNAKIICMGDLNDGSYNKSVKEGIGAKLKKEDVKEFGVYNPFEEMAKKGNASLFYRDSGDIFDQIMVSESLIKTDYSSYRYWKAGIYNKSFLIETAGQYKGYPKRNSPAEPGFSDHFPVYIYLIKEVK